MFEFVVVVTGVVIGLALTHLMQGVAKIIEHPTRVRIWWVDLGWLAYVIANSAFWWWWEFRLRLIGSWTFQLYGFVLAYPFFIYLICAVLFFRTTSRGIRDSEIISSRAGNGSSKCSSPGPPSTSSTLWLRARPILPRSGSNILSRRRGLRSSALPNC
jgi:hypothetical protein